MVKDDEKAAKSNKARETPNPYCKIGKEGSDGPNLGSGDSQSGEGIDRESRVSVDGRGGELVAVDGGKSAADGGDDMVMTLVEFSSKSSGKKGFKKVKALAREASKIGDGAETDERSANLIGGDSATLRRSRRKSLLVGPKDEDGEMRKEEKEEKEMEDEAEEEEEDEEESEFSVGDFVWGKVKSHPWWPGRVFDPSEASVQARKYKHGGKILVAYFGDATFAWCNPSQLKPFVENFAEMSNQSSSKGFISAVVEAVSEFSRLVELDMTCCCTPTRDESAPKGGVNVNKGGIGMYSVDRFDPATFIADLRLVAKDVSVANMLELTTLKSRVSAIYRPKDRHLLLKVNELLEDADDEGDGAEAGDSIRGPAGELVEIMPGMLDGSKRKERSVAEILYGNEKGNENGGTVEGEQASDTDLKSGRKRGIADESEKKTGDGGQSRGDDSAVTQLRKRKKELRETPEEKINHGNKAEEEKMGRKSSRIKVKGSPKPIVVENNLAAMEESEMSPRTRERKMSRYLCPPYTKIEYNRQTSVSSPRAPGQKAVESSNVSQKGDTSAKSASQLTGSPPLGKCSGEMFKKKLPKDGAEHEKSNASAAQTPKRGSKRKVVDDLTKNIASSNNVLSEIRAAARSGRFQEDQSSTVKEFLSSYRSSKYQNGSNDSPCGGSEADDKSGKKGKSSKVKHGVGAASSESKRMKSRAKHEKAKFEDKVNEMDSKSDGKTTGTPSAALVLKFPPDYPLPSGDDLVGLFGKFGALDTSKMQINQMSSSVRLVFLRVSDAEAACKSSKASNPFGTAKVSYRVCRLRAVSADKEVDENGFSTKDSAYPGSERKTRSSQKQCLTSPSDGGLRVVKQKLDGMAKMVAEGGAGKMSKDMKLNLETRLKDLLNEVKALPATPTS